MGGVYALYVIITSDDSGSTFCLSADKTDLVLPISKIENTKYLHEEARYHLRKCFDDTAIRFNEECSANYLVVQNILSINYIATKINLDPDKDIVITYGGILLKNNTSDGNFWYRLQYDKETKGYSTDPNLNLIIDNVIHKTLI